MSTPRKIAHMVKPEELQKVSEIMRIWVGFLKLRAQIIGHIRSTDGWEMSPNKQQGQVHLATIKQQ